MGSSIGPDFANIFMNLLETKYLKESSNSYKSLFYKKYVDDTLAAFQHKYQAQKFLQYINQIHPSLKFTIDTEHKSSINFLDISI